MYNQRLIRLESRAESRQCTFLELSFLKPGTPLHGTSDSGVGSSGHSLL